MYIDPLAAMFAVNAIIGAFGGVYAGLKITRTKWWRDHAK